MKIDRKQIGQRIRMALDKAKITQTQLSKQLGISGPSVTAYVQGSSNLPAEAYAVISEMCGVSIDWLITGREVPETSVGYTLQEVPETLPGGYVRADVFMLGGAGAPHDVAPEPIDSIFLPQKFLKDSIVPIKISGHSMEPIIFDGAYVGVDRNERRVISGEIYAVTLPYEGTVVKRIYMAADRVILKSDNQLFPELDIPIEKINPDNFIFGRVKWVLQEF